MSKDSSQQVFTANSEGPSFLKHCQLNPIALKKAKIVYKFGLSASVGSRVLLVKDKFSAMLVKGLNLQIPIK